MIKPSMHLSWLAPLALLLACGDDGSAPDGNDSSSGSSSSDGASVTLTTASTTMSTTDVTMTDPSSSSDPSTGPDPDGSSGSSGSESGSESGSSGSESGSESSTGSVLPTTYAPCDLTDPENPTCENKDEQCWVFEPMGKDSTIRHWCAPGCAGLPPGPEECPVVESGDAAVQCSALPGSPCALGCSDDETCPDGMECYDTMFGGVFRCVWETPAK